MKTKIVQTGLLAAIILVLVSWNLKKETLTVSGKVTDAVTHETLTGVAVSVKDGHTYVSTDMGGCYLLSVTKGKQLIFHLPGYETKTVTVRTNKLDVALVPAAEFSEEIMTVEEYTNIEVTEAPVAICSDQQYQMDCAYPENTEEYGSFAENRFKSVASEPLSTFSIDVDAASYSNMRRFINRGQLPPKEAIRTEELVNYFTYDYPEPAGNNPVNIQAEAGICPWNPAHRLVRIGMKAKSIAGENLPASNFVFLIDVSGSMYGAERLGLVKSSLNLLINNLRETDKVAIVVYSGAASVILPSTPGNNKQKIKDALNSLKAGGSTAGAAGIELAYKIARQNFISNGNNRVILCTDGDFNVGVSSSEALEKLIGKERKSGTYLTVLGYGMGNYKDEKMQILAEKGNGNHAYIDNLQEANRVLVNEFGSTMHTVANDVKLQVEFNPANVQAYRLIGYESRLLDKEDFNDDTKDAGELGAGHTVTAFYEIVPAGTRETYPGKVDELKYQASLPSIPGNFGHSPELLTVKVRYKLPESANSLKMEMPLIDKGNNRVSNDFLFASAVAMFGQLLRESGFKGDATYEKVISLAKQGLGNDEQGYRREFIRLAETVKGLAK